MENHTQKMLLSKNATSLGALLKKCLKACRTSWKCKKYVSARGRGKPEPEVVEKPRPLLVLWRFRMMVAPLVAVLTISMMPTSSIPSMPIFEICKWS